MKLEVDIHVEIAFCGENLSSSWRTRGICAIHSDWWGWVTAKRLQDTLGLCAAITPKRPIHHQSYETVQHHLAQAKTRLFPE